MPVDWTYEEIVLVCDAVVDNGWKGLNHGDARVPALSKLLRAMSPEHAAADPKFRNVNGVTRKAGDCQTAHPAHQGTQTRGGRTTQHVVDLFIADETFMRSEAAHIRANATAPHPAAPPLDVDDDEGADEGSPYLLSVLARERDPKLRRDKVNATRAKHGCVRCELCAFDFEAAYGERGRDYCEVHHRNPLSVAGLSKTKLSDLAVLCSNCHRMIHRRRPWLTVEQLGELMGL